MGHSTSIPLASNSFHGGYELPTFRPSLKIVRQMSSQDRRLSLFRNYVRAEEEAYPVDVIAIHEFIENPYRTGIYKYKSLWLARFFARSSPEAPVYFTGYVSAVFLAESIAMLETSLAVFSPEFFL